MSTQRFIRLSSNQNPMQPQRTKTSYHPWDSFIPRRLPVIFVDCFKMCILSIFI
jgi:hypothetical protein